MLVAVPLVGTEVAGVDVGVDDGTDVAGSEVELDVGAAQSTWAGSPDAPAAVTEPRPTPAKPSAAWVVARVSWSVATPSCWSPALLSGA